MAEEDAKQNGALRRVCEVNFEAVTDARERVVDNATAASRWLMATLVTINSGLAVVAMSSENLATGVRQSIALCSGIGIVAAVMLGYSTILASRPVLGKLNDVANSWMAGVVGREISVEEIQTKEEAVQTAARPWTIVAHACGWISLLSFGISGVWLAISIE